MQFDWDAANIEHIAQHGVTPEEAEQVLANAPLDRGVVSRNGEQRTLHLGQTEKGATLFLVVTDRNSLYRVVTARPANRKEREFYSKWKEALDERTD